MYSKSQPAHNSRTARRTRWNKKFDVVKTSIEWRWTILGFVSFIFGTTSQTFPSPMSSLITIDIFFYQQQHIATAIVTYDGWIIARNCGKGVFRNKIKRLPNKFPRKTITMKIFSFSRLLLVFIKPKQIALQCLSLGLSWKINILFFSTECDSYHFPYLLPNV